jgi:hypothetical protein
MTKYPWYIEQNPLLNLLSIENIELYDNLQKGLSASWAAHVAPRLSKWAQQYLAFQWAAHVLPLYEKLNPQPLQGEKYPQPNIPRQTLVFTAHWLDATKDPKRKLTAYDPLVIEQKAVEAIADKNADAVAAREWDTDEEHVENYVMKGAALAAACAVSLEPGNYAMAGQWARSAATWAYRLTDPNEQSGTATEAGDKEREWQAAQVRKLWRIETAQLKRDALYTQTMVAIQKRVIADKATKEQIAKAVQAAKEGADKIVLIMRTEEYEDWPLWLGVGLTVGMVAAMVVMGPEALLAYGAVGAAEYIGGAAAAANIARVSVIGAEGFELAELVIKLRQAGLIVIPAAEVVAKVAR